MSKIQQIFERIQKSKKEQKAIKSMIKDALTNSRQYQEILDEMKALKEKKRKIEQDIKDDFKKELGTLDQLKAEIENDQMLLADATLSVWMEGNIAEVTDEYENKLEPIFKVTYRRN